ILSADRVIHEQLLGLDWYQPGQPLLHKTDLASYRSAMQVVAELFKDKVNQKAVNSPGAHTVQFQDEAGLLRQILQKIADNSGFLVEERLKELLAPYSERERTLIRIDNVFSGKILNVPQVTEDKRKDREGMGCSEQLYASLNGALFEYSPVSRSLEIEMSCIE
ncbi:unnamed protein product, partial [Timema podura]|nr:unnamed protein product [Timema podura]